MALVVQEPQLFSYSIAENISYGLTVTEAEIVEAAVKANAHVFISGFENGYQTVVGQLGSQLSGGQRQRIAIARAFLRENFSKILLLDEATSALDIENEQLVFRALERNRAGRTTLIVAHRLSTIQMADTIAVLDAGRIVEQGTHAELLARSGYYYRLVNKLKESPDNAGGDQLLVSEEVTRIIDTALPDSVQNSTGESATLVTTEC